ncbi:MAG TPA: ATP-binding cassette domain-containing protein [Trebonia sp.]|nr:ATP-binding cassette domain-containing protein [Trebonia sp.]
MTALASRVRRDRRDRLGGPARGRQAAAVVIAVCYLLFTQLIATGSLYSQSLVLTAACFAILAISLDMVAGMTGLYSLGHAGLFACGAYATTLLNSHLGLGVFTVAPIAVAGTGLVGLVLGSLSLRVSGLYFAITTFIFTLVVGVLASDLSITGGLQGIEGPLFPAFPAGLSGLGSSVTWCVMLALLVTIFLAVAIRGSALYPVLLAIRDAEPFAAAAGVRTAAVKIGMFGLSAALAGLAGWCFSFLGIVSPGQFSWNVSVNILVMVILGGINTTVGPIIGAAFVSMFPAYVNFSALWQELLFGALFVLVIVFFPEGLTGLVVRLARWLRPRLRLAGATTASAVPAAAPPEAAAAPAADGIALRAPAGGRKQPAVECHNLTFGYTRGAVAVDNVSLVVRGGTIHGLIGPNGSGKSTLVSLIAGQRQPAAGSIRINGTDATSSGPWTRPRHGLARTFQTAVLVKELTARANVAIGLYSQVPRIALRAPVWPLLPAARRQGRDMAARAGNALAQVGMGSWAGTRVAEVPHGVEQLTQLAAAAVSGSGVLVLDEPLAGLSPGEVEHVAGILRDFRAAGGTVIIIEHQVQFVFGICDEVTVLSAGSVVASGPAAEVRQDARVREVYLGQ